MAGRCFVYISFPVAMTATWAPAAEGVWGALNCWTTASEQQTAAQSAESGTANEDGRPRDLVPPPLPQAVTGATPMAYLKTGRMVLVSDESAVARPPFVVPEDQVVRVRRTTFWVQEFFGRLSGTAGVTSVLLILIGGGYLYYTKTASRTIILWLIGTYGVLSQILYMCGVPPVQSATTALLGGGFLFGAFFMATDPVSAPKTELVASFIRSSSGHALWSSATFPSSTAG